MTVSRQRAVLMYLCWLFGFTFSYVQVFGSHLDRFVARDELYKTHTVHSHAMDGRRLQVVAGASVRKTEAFSQNRPTQGCATSAISAASSRAWSHFPHLSIYPLHGMTRACFRFMKSNL